MTYLLDVNLLIALIDPAHIHHGAAHQWFKKRGSKSWASCPLTENGFVRIVSHPRYPNIEMMANQVLEHLRLFFESSPNHQFWSDSVSLVDTTLFNPDFFRASSQVTDIYLLGLAKSRGGALATFDRSIPLSGVLGSGRELLELI